ncbi:type 4 pilus major pilin [Ralstonia sp. ASV6]|uniref:type 4 pilus major pilin n=1 Tax=Ralstonia sp. ASV6 TaxID=2795124 RepID=UPI001E42ED0D|nr:type 4 pilus major pilin [Ralstonia sp. ASV6]
MTTNMMMNAVGVQAAGDVHAGEDLRGARALAGQRGMGALEWIAIIALLGLFLYGVLSRLGLMNASNSSVSESSAISSLYTSARSNLKGASGYAANGADLIVPLNAVNGLPKNLSYNAGVLLNTYGTAYTLVASNGGYGFTLTDPGISAADCAKLVVQQSSSGNWSGGISVNGTALGTAPIATGTATGACNAATNSIAFASLT